MSLITNGTTEKAIYEKGRAGYPAVYLRSSEDTRSLLEITEAANKMNRKLYTWTLGKGLTCNNKVVNDTETPNDVIPALTKVQQDAIVVLKHFHHFLEDPVIQAGILDAIPNFKERAKMLIILTPVKKLPLELEKEFAYIETELPNREIMSIVLDGIIKMSGLKGDKLPNEEMKRHLIEGAMGLTTQEAENAFSLALVRPKIEKSDIVWDPTVVMDEKCATLQKTGMLQYYRPSKQGMKAVGGMKNLKEWVSKRKKVFTDEAKKFGLPDPKGILMVGIPGSGKSLGAKALAEELELPLLRCDMGKIFAGIVGASEENARRVIETAEAVAPCVLWLDEIEKGFAGMGGNGSLDSGVGARVFGTILTWMQEKKAPVFIYATANDVTALPPELLRKGRFDEIFSVMLPTYNERKEIFEIHIRNKGREKLIGSKLNLDDLSKETEGFSGSEIEAVVTSALFSAFSAGTDLSMKDLKQSIKETVPLSQTMAERIKHMEQWCKDRARPASAEYVSESHEPKVGRKLT